MTAPLYILAAAAVFTSLTIAFLLIAVIMAAAVGAHGEEKKQ